MQETPRINCVNFPNLLNFCNKMQLLQVCQLFCRKNSLFVASERSSDMQGSGVEEFFRSLWACASLLSPQACEIRGPVVGIKVDERTPGPEVVLAGARGCFLCAGIGSSGLSHGDTCPCPWLSGGFVGKDPNPLRAFSPRSLSLSEGSCHCPRHQDIFWRIDQ